MVMKLIVGIDLGESGNHTAIAAVERIRLDTTKVRQKWRYVIRFLEAWGMNDAKFTYRGSVVSLWHSQQATGPFRAPGSPGAYYGPPERDWGYDPLFNTSLPPGARAFSVITITKARWSRN